MENINLKNIIEETIRKEVKRAILESTTSKEVYIIKNKKGEPIEICQTQEEAEEKKVGYESKHPEQELIIEPGEEPTFDELDAMSEKLDNMENIDETKKEHKGHFTMEQVMKLAKKAGDVVPDAQDDLEELCEMYGEKIPASRVFEILDDYDMPELKSKIKIKQTEPKEGAFVAPELSVDEKLYGDQDKLDVDGDGEIEADDLSKLRSGEHNEEEDCDECGGGSMEESKVKKIYYHVLEDGGYGDIGYQGVYDTEEEAKSRVHSLSDMFPDSSFYFEASNSEKEPYSVTSSKYNPDDDIDEGEAEVCETCGKEMCECGSGMYETKKSVRLSESELVKLISGMVNEAVPGLTAFQKAHKESGSQNKQALSDVEKKIKQYLTFDGNDNPEFPGHNKGDVEARQSTGDEADEIADNRGGGLEDLDYDVEPSDKFKERLEMSLKGDVKMGNAQKDVANVIPSDLGDKMIKKVKRRKEAKEAAPMYIKDPEPTKNVNESTVISEEIKRMKEMLMYNKKTQ